MANSRTATPSIDVSTVLEFVVNGEVYRSTFGELPFDNVLAIVRRTIKHKLGNESYSSALNKALEVAGVSDNDKMSRDEKSEASKAWREANPDAWKELLISESAKMWEDILTPGKITETDRARVNPVEREYLILLDKAIAEKFRGLRDEAGKAIKPPANDTDVVKFSDDDVWTRAELRDAVASEPSDHDDYETRGEELRAQAETIAEAKKLKPAATPTTAEPVKSAAAIGLVKRKAA